ncbi:MAG: DsbA family protein [Cytophagales bacterium CG12_big_fil_rev_8_21_14_0_65_40_12]|nr:MAG: DsbA family protein [Cytophagales bacterium CG12_big_fil_rev_8_21_14_0_65_40_12]PIW05041.1 MAG: DsbA family protein [Cytophagales bacterium CG17_big_fil_post_rev_8_21_14_2_50_40_13]
MKVENQSCDPETGICAPAELAESPSEIKKEADKEIIYVGDPMCSWCWGISNHLKALKEYYPEFGFSIIVGGLRPGGGEAWDDNMKAFLRHHWQEVTARSGQPFGYQLFEREEFNYDTEPSCRAVVASRQWMEDNELAFYEAVSRKFYVDNEDPTESEFYRSICEQFDIPFDVFLAIFESDQCKYETHQEFQLNRQWGVRGYPTVLFKIKDQLYQINHGYTEFDQMKSVIEKILKEENQLA